MGGWKPRVHAGLYSHEVNFLKENQKQQLLLPCNFLIFPVGNQMGERSVRLRRQFKLTAQLCVCLKCFTLKIVYDAFIF